MNSRGRPRMWRFWQALPRKGRIGIFLSGWYEGPAKRLEYFLAQMPPDLDGELRIVGNIREPVKVRDLAVEHLAHEEMLGKAHAAQFGEVLDGGGLLHGGSAVVRGGYCCVR